MHLKGSTYFSDPDFAGPKFIGPPFLGARAAASGKDSSYLQEPILPEAVEADLGNKLKHFTQWINPDMKGQGRKECILRCKDEKVAKTKTKKAEKSPPSTKRPMKGHASREPGWTGPLGGDLGLDCPRLQPPGSVLAGAGKPQRREGGFLSGP